MRYLPFAALLLAVPAGPAAAQSPELEKACISVAQNFLLAPSIKTGVVQSFPELEPPGARMTYSTREDAKPSDFSNEIECEFSSTAAPLNLTRFCISDVCYSENEQEQENRRRYLEVKALMDRQQ